MSDGNAIKLPRAVEDLVAAHAALVKIYESTKLKFTFDGKLLGDIGEATAASAFNLTLCKKRTKGIDAHTSQGRSVQIKVSAIGKGPAYSPGIGRADHLIFMHLDLHKCTATIIYNGPEEPIRNLLPKEFSGTKRISLPKVVNLNASIAESQRIRRRN